MKKLLAFVMAICVLCCGCGVITDSRASGKPVPVSVLNMSDSSGLGRVVKASLYFLNTHNGTLMAEQRTLDIGQDVNPAEVAVEELLKGPSSLEELSGVAPEGMRLDYIEYSRNVANVYLLYDGVPMTAKAQYTLELALANTITDLLGAVYTNVFFNGMQPGFSGLPWAPLQKQTGSIDDAWSQVSKYAYEMPVSGMPQPPVATTAPQTDLTEPTPTTSTITTVLYFISADGGFILPEAREVDYTNGEYIQALISELKKGPQNTAVMTSPLANDLELEQEPSLTVNGDGSYTLRLDFSALPAQYFGSEDVLLSYASIIYTITGFIPGVRDVEIFVKGTQITSIEGLPDFSENMRRDEYTGYIGSSATLYFADVDTDLLLEVSRSMEQEKIWSAKQRVFEILKGPLTGDGDNVWPVMPSGVTEADILYVDVYSDTAYVNLSEHFKSACAGLSSKNEMLLVYSIVNTITAMDGVTKVQFLVEGQQTNTLAGYLCLSDPFLRNYGIIKKSG